MNFKKYFLGLFMLFYANVMLMGIDIETRLDKDSQDLVFLVKNRSSEPIEFGEWLFTYPNLSIILVSTDLGPKIINPERFPESRAGFHKILPGEIREIRVSLKNRFPSKLDEIGSGKYVLLWVLRGEDKNRYIDTGALIF